MRLFIGSKSLSKAKCWNQEYNSTFFLYLKFEKVRKLFLNSKAEIVKKIERVPSSLFDFTF